MLSLELKAAAVIGSVAVLAGIGMYFISIGSKLNEAKHVEANAKAESHIVETAIAVAGDFAKLGSDIVNKVQNVRTETQTVTQTQVKYVHDHPLPVSCAIGAPIIELRDSQLRSIYEAANSQLPGNSDGRRAAGAAVVNKPTGPTHR